MSRSIEHAAEIVFLLVIIFIFYGSSEGFRSDPYGSGLKYFTFNSSSTSGPGTNSYLYE
jgi:hypothetical protein